MNVNSGVQLEVQQYTQDQSQQQSDTPQQQCKECGLYFDTTKSLDVHMHFTHENKLNKWSTIVTTQQHSKERNNNNTKANSSIKREFITNNTADSSDSMTKKSPEYHRATPEAMFGHPPTPQSYQSASSPYQNQDNSTYSPSFQNYQHQVKVESLSPTNNLFQNSYSNFNDNFLSLDQHQSYNQEYPVQKASSSNNSYRYHPYQVTGTSPQFERLMQSQVQSSSPAFPPQPTPSPSPKTCDKCGYVCETAAQLIDHLNLNHPPTPAPHLSTFQANQHYMFGTDSTQIKLENTQSEILDLDSHKVQVFSGSEKRQNGDHNSQNSHSVTTLIGNWSQHPQVQNQQKMYQDHIFLSNQDQKLYSQSVPSTIPEQKIFQSHQIQSQDYIGNSVPTTQESLGQSPTSSYRAFEHLPPQTNSVISSSQVPSTPTPTAPSTTKSASWKSNEARRPKTYNCTACNKWFTSSGHLKRHYNTTLHKNAVKSSGQPDPATLPISAHHHPTRESTTREDRSSNSPSEDSRGDDANTLPIQYDRSSALPGLLPQPPSGPYDRQPAPNIHQPPPLHSPMAHGSPLGNMLNIGNINSSNGSPPNGEAGLSTVNLDSRGLLSLSANSSIPGFNMAPPMMPMENNQFQMYPNESAPHVTQDMAINSLNTTGELQFIAVDSTEVAPLPSFAQINAHRYNLLVSYGDANVGGGGPVTAPYSYISQNPFENMEPRIIYRTSDYEEDYKPTILGQSDQINYSSDSVLTFSSSPVDNITSIEQDFHNNNISDEDNKVNIMNEINELKMRTEQNSNEVVQNKKGYEKSAKKPKTSTVQSKKNEVNKCHDCDKYFNKACYLTQHNKTFHSGLKPFKCTRCGKRFGCEKIFDQHFKKHAGDKPHKCDMCPKQFNHKTDLRRHMCLHSGYKPFKCETCDKGFIRKDHMLKHCETHTRKAQNKSSAAVR